MKTSTTYHANWSRMVMPYLSAVARSATAQIVPIRQQDLHLKTQILSPLQDTTMKMQRLSAFRPPLGSLSIPSVFRTWTLRRPFTLLTTRNECKANWQECLLCLQCLLLPCKEMIFRWDTTPLLCLMILFLRVCLQVLPQLLAHRRLPGEHKLGPNWQLWM